MKRIDIHEELCPWNGRAGRNGGRGDFDRYFNWREEEELRGAFIIEDTFNILGWRLLNGLETEKYK